MEAIDLSLIEETKQKIREIKKYDPVDAHRMYEILHGRTWAYITNEKVDDEEAKVLLREIKKIPSEI